MSFSRVDVESQLDELMEEAGEGLAGQIQSLVHLALQVGRFEGLDEAKGGKGDGSAKIPWLVRPKGK